MFRRLRKHLIKRGQVGQSIVILALGMIALLGFVGITTDISLLFVRYSTLRRAVDSAAIAAAGQIRQSGDDESDSSDVVARASLAARQFIEFHGLNPINVAVEMCENQPRLDYENEKGLQAEPNGVTEARATMYAAVKVLEDLPSGDAGIPAQRDVVQVEQAQYIDQMVIFIGAQGISMSDGTISAQAAYDAALAAYLADKSDTNWDDLYDKTGDYITFLENDSDFQEDDDEICTPDQRKLVRVTAQVNSPTVFLRLLGWRDIMLQASAISETAVLDVVMVMDVSESMLADTTYDDWAMVNLGTAYIPPQLWTTRKLDPSDASSTVLLDDDASTVTGQLMAAGFLPSLQATGSFSHVVHTLLHDGPLWTAYPPAGAGDVPTGTAAYDQWSAAGNPTLIPGGGIWPNGGTWVEWFWLNNILGQWQATINNRMNFVNGAGVNVDGKTPEADPIPNLLSQSPVPSTAYNVRSFVPSGISGTQGHPRPACRVRFYPYSLTLDLTTDWPAYVNESGSVQTIAELYDEEGGIGNAEWNNLENWDNPGYDQPRWSAFVPTYNFYGCCNDPTWGLRVSDGVGGDTPNGINNGDFVFVDGTGHEVLLTNEVPVVTDPFDPGSFNVEPDYDFSDLVCQPFKQAKDATRAFLRRVDFLRGDRVAFVTFDRSAFLIDPDGNQTIENHMIETYDRAVDVLDRYIGVRSEPNFYVWDYDNGGWTGLAAGFNEETGASQPVNYDAVGSSLFCTEDDPSCPEQPVENLTDEQLANLNNYPVYNGCYIQNALLTYPYSLYASRSYDASPDVRIQPDESGTGGLGSNYRVSDPALLRLMNPNYYTTAWENFVTSASDSISTTSTANDWVSGTVRGALNMALYDDPRAEGTRYDPVRVFQSSYERHGICRGGNVGAALRQASSALNDPRTSRRDGAVWIIIVLGDGASGGTDPVRRQGAKLAELSPYEAIEVFNYTSIHDGDWQTAPTGDPTDNDQNLFGATRAGYGAYGLCPYGVVAGESGVMIDRVGELVLGNPNAFPWCLDKDPYTRHFCVNEPGISVGFSDTDAGYGPGFRPNAFDSDFRFRIYDPDVSGPAEDPFDYDAHPEEVAPMPDTYQFSESQWILEENAQLGNIFDVDLGLWELPTSTCDPLYDPDDYARDWADYIAGVDEEDAVSAQLPTIFTIGFGLDFENGSHTCADNIEDCLGEELLRYIADAGDNYKIDNDVQQDILDNRDQWRVNPSWSYPTLDGTVTDWGVKDPCEPDLYLNGEETFRVTTGSTDADLVTRTAGESCGNYYNAPSAVELQAVFDDIASRMFTRLTG